MFNRAELFHSSSEITVVWYSCFSSPVFSRYFLPYDIFAYPFLCSSPLFVMQISIIIEQCHNVSSVNVIIMIIVYFWEVTINTY